jgi:hypothetical protein
MNKTMRLAVLAAALSPGIAFAQSAPQTFSDLANQIVGILGSATTDLIVLAIVVYFWGVSSSLFDEGKEGHKRLRQQLLWGVIVLFFAVSIWGIIQILQTSFFGSDIGSTTGNSGPVQTCTSLSCQYGAH